ncbi:MAG TPA: LamG domain-containing protein, partial [Armatimonadota bacterium]|nr:LamG domain-containing protein [Armatimonadota bacterium]
IAHVFRTAQESVAAVWCPDGDELTSIYVAKRRATVTDIMGNDESMPAGGDVLWLPTGESVRYVRDLSDDAEGRGTLQAFDPCQVARGETGTLTMRMRNPFDSEWQASPTLLATENQPLRITKDGVVKADEVTELHFGPLETVTVDGPVEVDPDAIPGIYAVTGAGLTSPVEIAVRGAAPDAGPVGVWKLDEGEGTVITDSSGTGNDGTVAEPKWVEGVSGTALEFDGTQTAEIPTSASLNLQDEMTLAFWIRLGPETGDWQFPVGKYSHDPLVRNYGMYIHKDTLDPCFSASFEDGGYAHTDVRSNMPINDGEWHHVVATCSVFDARTRIYVDGEPVVDQVMAEGLMLVADAPLRIGASTVGAIDEVMVWPRVLNGEEVSELALGGD